jgi:cysteine desulfurase
MKPIYLDNAAATPLENKVKLVMEPYFSEKFYNPSANYLSAKSVSKDIEKARADIAYWLGSKPNEIIFTAGGTEANNLALNGVMELNPEANLVVSAIEHESVLKPAEKYNHKFAPVDKEGQINLTKLQSLIDNKTVLVCIMYASNEIGTLQPIIQVSKIIEKIRNSRINDNNKLPIYLHVDACQAPSYLDLHVSRLGVDLMTLNSGKIYGPKQFGALYILGFAEALTLVQKDREQETIRLNQLQKYFIDKLTGKIPESIINGSIKRRLPNNVHITIPGQDNEILLMRLDEMGIICASGSACNASNEDVSTTLTAIGISEKDAQASLRFTMGRSTTKEDIKYVINALKSIV